ncbi:MAG: hypothetical protein WCX77_00840 [Candidatus Paceibacterota bacterium]|jgi:hypothetical protein
MQKEISEQQFWEAYDAIPAELQDAIFSEKTAKAIFNACVENGIEDERISKVAKNVGDVLLGLLSPEQLQPTLELDLNLESQASENICQAIYNTIFEPVRSQLAELYLHNNEERKETKIKIEVEPKIEKPSSEDVLGNNPKKEDKKPIPAKSATEKSSSVSYREPIG